MTAWNSTSPTRSDRLAKRRLAIALSIRPSNPKRRVVFSLGRIGIAFLDGHVDYFGGDTSPSGEAADMDLAIVCGYGPAGLVDMAGSVPMVDSGEVVVVGYHPDSEDASSREDELVDERTQLVEARAVRRGDPERLRRYVAQRLEAQARRFWIHFDADVFDEVEM